jgi:NADH:ubiquinone oxidoreductase subunit E
MAEINEDNSAESSVVAGWSGSSKDMFEKMIQIIPEVMRSSFREKLIQMAHHKAQGSFINEDHIKEIVEEIVPEPFKTKILKTFAAMGGVDLNEVENIIDKNRGGNETIINMLHSVQELFGYIPREALILISQRKGIFLSKLYRLVTSYKAFSIAEPGKHIITLCNGTGCHVRGESNLLKEVEAKLAENGSEITLEKVRCLGCCDLSPAVSVDGVIYSGEKAHAKISEILSK